MPIALRFAAASALLSLACGGAPQPTPEAAPATPGAATPTEPTPEPQPDPKPERRPEPKADPKMDPAARAAYRKALDDGRKAHRAKDYPAAIAAFDRALALFADDPRALNERGWARYKGGDLPGAEADTRGALARTVDARLIGASWYNLGRIFEDRQQLDEAQRAYRRSLDARPNDTVRARLARLDPSAAAPLAATRLDGPFADDAALCAHMRTVMDFEEAEKPQCVLPSGPPIEGAPFGARFARTFVSLFGETEPDAEPDGPGSDFWHLVLDVPAGRYVLTHFASTYNPGAFGIYEEVDLAAPTARTLPDGRTLLWLAVTHDRRDSDMGLNEVEMWHTRFVYVCGLGTGGVPACIGPLSTQSSASRELLFEGEDEPGMEHDLWSNGATFSVELLDSGALEVKATGRTGKGADGSHVGVHRLEFP